MELLNYIFYLGINYIIFSILWFFIAASFKLLTQQLISANYTAYITKSFQYYLLSAITSLSTMKFIAKNEALTPLFVFLGGFILFLYLAGKMKKNKMLFALKAVINNNLSPQILKYEPHLLGLVIILYAFSFSFPLLVNNPLNTWFKETIENIYNTPIIGGIVSLAGAVFLITMIFKGVQTITKYWEILKAYITGKPTTIQRDGEQDMDQFNEFKNSINQNQNQEIEIDDDYVDFEEIKDDQDK